MITARDIMTFDPIVIRTNDRISVCMDLFIRNKIKFAPVIDLDLVVRGVLTEFALIRLFTAHVMSGQDNAIGRHLEDFSHIEAVRESDSLGQVVSRMKAASNERVVVLDQRNRLTGIISPYDVMKFLTEEKIKHGTWGKMVMAHRIEQHESILRKLAEEFKVA